MSGISHFYGTDYMPPYYGMRHCRFCGLPDGDNVPCRPNFEYIRKLRLDALILANALALVMDDIGATEHAMQVYEGLGALLRIPEPKRCEGNSAAGLCFGVEGYCPNHPERNEQQHI